MAKKGKRLNIESRIQRKVFKRRRIIKKRKKKGYLFSPKSRESKTEIKELIYAPSDFRFINNPTECLFFFNNLRSQEKCSFLHGRRFFRISLAKVEHIDFATISILKCIFEESKFHGINYHGLYPKNGACHDFLRETGFFNNMYGVDSKQIEIEGSGSYFSFEKRQGMLTLHDLVFFENVSEESYKFVTGRSGHIDEIITVLKEIGGNAIEWSNSFNNQWQVGI